MDQSRRLEFQAILQNIMGKNKVYFQPPASLMMDYPCIVYSLDDVWTRHASNLPYARAARYKTMLIDRNPDTSYSAKLGALPLSSFSSSYVVDGLNHHVYTIYF